MVLHLAVCELYHPQIHGASEDPPTDIAERFIIREILSLDDFLGPELDEVLSTSYDFYRDYGERLGEHPTIRNYHAIVARPDYVRVDIVAVENCAGRDGLEWCTGSLKTPYIRILQRAWRNAHKRRNAYIRICKSPYALRCRETTGRFLRSPRRPTTQTRLSTRTPRSGLSTHTVQS